MKLYNFTLQKNLNYYFIVIYTQINFRLFKSFNFLPKNFIKKYTSLVWFDLNYKSEVKNNALIKCNLIDNYNNYFNVISFRVLCNQSSTSKYTRYLQISALNFNVNRSVFNSLKQFSSEENTNINVGYNIISMLLNSINFLYIIKFFNKMNYLFLFKNYDIANHLNFKRYDKLNLQKKSLNFKPTFNLNFKFL